MGKDGIMVEKRLMLDKHRNVVILPHGNQVRKILSLLLLCGLMRTQLKQIFVGRQKELEDLSLLWDDATDPRGYENFVYVYFNAPGIGKTTLLKRFGEKLEQEEKGVHIEYKCTEEFSSEQMLIRSLLITVLTSFKQRFNFVLNYIDRNSPEFLKEHTKKEFDALYSKILSSLDSETYTMDMLTGIIKHLSSIVPIYFALDEVQVFEQISNPESNETLFHYLTRILKAFLGSPVLMVLSGTQYHILREIGASISSPLREKTIAKIISPLKPVHLEQYVDELENVFHLTIDVPLRNYLLVYMQSFSGGHPRTITIIVDTFFDLYDEKKFDLVHLTREGFISNLTKVLTRKLVKNILRSDQRQGLLDLQSSQQFSIAKDWVVKGAYTNLTLGERPSLANEADDVEFEHVVFRLMTLGIIVQNGQEKYYLTSYFHLVRLLESNIGGHDLFLREVLQNRFFRLLCGGHSGFGFTFETIIYSALLIRYNQVASTNRLPLDLSGLTTIEMLSGEINYEQLTLKQGILYHTPLATGIDGIYQTNETIIVIQITAREKVPQNKVDTLEEQRLKIAHYRPANNVLGWFISLFETKFDANDSLIITEGKSLKEILGEAFYEHLLAVKGTL